MFGFERGVYSGTVKADDDVAVDIEYWDAGLLRFVERFLHVLVALLNVFIGVFDAEFVEIFLGGMAKRTPRRAIDSNF